MSYVKVLFVILLAYFVGSCECFNLTKCCEINQVWDFSDWPHGAIRCGPSGPSRWRPLIYPHLSSSQNTVLEDTSDLIISHPRNWCESGSINIYALKENGEKELKKDVFKILSDGSVWIKRNKRKYNELTSGSFCVDGAKSLNISSENGNFSGDFGDTVIVDCGEHFEDSCGTLTPQTSNVYAISLALASVFLLATVVVYLLLFEKQNVHGWTSLCYFASLWAMYVLTAIVRLDFMFFSQKEEGVGCFIVAISTHFFWISTFCWMSCVNFDLWWKFRSLLPTGSKSKGLRRFLAYALFSNGVPLLIVSLGLTLDNLYRDDLENSIITPQYATTTCFVEQELALFPFVYGPIGILLAINFIFFLATVVHMYRLKQSTKMASASSSKNNKQKQSLMLFAKLFLLMGVPWGVEVISWATTPCGQLTWYWSIFDYINIFQSAAIFATFVCNSETINSLEAKYPGFKGFMSLISISSERSEKILTRWPYLKPLISPLMRGKKKELRTFSSSSASAKTNSTGTTQSSKNSTTFSANPKLRI